MNKNTLVILQKIFCIMLVITLMCSMTMVAYATDPTPAPTDGGGTDTGDVGIGDVFNQANSTLNTVITEIQKFATYLVILLSIAGFIMRMHANQQTAATATKWLTRIWISYGGIMAVGLLVKVIESVVGDNGASTALPSMAMLSLTAWK